MLLESIGRSYLFGGCNRAELCDSESYRRQGFVKSIDLRSLKGSSTCGRLGLEGLLLFVYSNLFSGGSIYRFEGGGEVFCRVLRFSLQLHIAVLYCVCILLPYSFSFHFIIDIWWIWLRVVILFVYSHLLYSTLSLS